MATKQQNVRMRTTLTGQRQLPSLFWSAIGTMEEPQLGEVPQGRFPRFALHIRPDFAKTVLTPDMEPAKIILLRNVFFRAFVVGVLFALIFLILTLALWNTWARWVVHLFAIDEKDLGRIVLEFFTHVRIVLVFFFLVPAIALHWTARKQQL
jgi:hypothetical protein